MSLQEQRCLCSSRSVSDRGVWQGLVRASQAEAAAAQAAAAELEQVHVDGAARMQVARLESMF